MTSVHSSLLLFVKHTSYSYIFAVRLGSFSNLKRLTYGSPRRDSGLQYAVKQLKGVGSLGGLVQVTFDVAIYTTSGRLNENTCQTLDELLSGNKFPSLNSIFLHDSINFQHFPKLNKLGLLKILSHSYLRKYVMFIRPKYIYCAYLKATR